MKDPKFYPGQRLRSNRRQLLRSCQRVYVSGSLPHGDWKGFRVASEAKVVSVHTKTLLVTIDRVELDERVTAFAPKAMASLISCARSTT